MKTIIKIIPIIIIIIIVGIIFSTNALIIATDTTEGGIPGVDMAATWNLQDGFQWIYPGSSFNSEHQTLHNIYLDDPDSPYEAAVDIMEYTYNMHPNLVITVNNAAAERIYGVDLISNIREYDWNSNYDRAPAIQAATQNTTMNYGGIITSILSGDIAFHFV